MPAACPANFQRVDEFPSFIPKTPEQRSIRGLKLRVAKSPRRTGRPVLRANRREVTVSFSINTNIAALDAQNYLQTDSKFQTQTINEVTSGLRIVNSGDDAAGLAIANSLRNSQAVLTQGIQNANDGLSTLQTIDGGVNNISQLLDRASTLATESSSSTFTGDRGVLNSEFQSVLSEVNRQAQAVGLNSGGTFAQALSVFIGGGRQGGTTSAIQNGSINLDLSKSSVDTQALGLSGFSATGNSTVDIGDGAGTTSVANILANTSNQASQTQAGFTKFYFTGPGFASTSGTDRVAVSVNLSGVTDAATLATAINSAISAAGTGGSQQATAFKNAGISASVSTDSSGASHLQFTSSTSAFQVEAGDQTANALLGNIQSTNQGQSVVTQTSTANATALLATSANANPETVQLTLNNGSSADLSPTIVSLTIGAGEAQATTLANLTTALQGTGVTAALSGGKLQFTSGQGQSLSVQVAGDTSNVLGLGTFLTGAGNSASYTSITAGAAATATATQSVQIAIGGQVASFAGLTTGASEATALSALNTAFQSNTLTRAANLAAVDNGGNVEITSGNGTAFRLNVFGDGADTGFGFAAAAGQGVDSSTTATLTATAQGSDVNAPSIDSTGTSTSGFLNFTGISVNGSSQNITLSAPDASGTSHSIDISLNSGNAGSIDQAISTINTALLQSNDSTLGQIVAVKDQSSGSDGIRFVSGLNNFDLSLGTTATGTSTAANIQGISQGTGAASQGGPIIASSALGTGSTVDISSLGNAENAVTALTNAVTALGRSQAAVGKGENLFNYAINLAQSQVTNEAASESGIRDANMATEASNLSKAQILVQAGTAALAQANSAPQAILTLLRG
jgi:flagellin